MRQSNRKEKYQFQILLLANQINDFLANAASITFTKIIGRNSNHVLHTFLPFLHPALGPIPVIRTQK